MDIYAILDRMCAVCSRVMYSNESYIRHIVELRSGDLTRSSRSYNLCNRCLERVPRFPLPWEDPDISDPRECSSSDP
jgi:hypothetical protein